MNRIGGNDDKSNGESELRGKRAIIWVTTRFVAMAMIWKRCERIEGEKAMDDSTARRQKTLGRWKSGRCFEDRNRGVDDSKITGKAPVGAPQVCDVGLNAQGVEGTTE